MIPEIAVWLIFLLPLASFAIIALVIRPFFNRYPQISGHITILSIAIALVLSGWALMSTVMEHGRSLSWFHPWLAVGDLEFRVGVMLDPLTAVMLVVVTGVSLMVQVYSTGYMARDPGYSRYFAFMSLFTASMVGLVISANILQLYVFWELVGLCSYLLIGFWYHRPAAAAAAKKAFIVTRIGDFGFLVAILYLFFNQGLFIAQGRNPLEIPDIYWMAKAGVLGGMAITWLAVGIFSGAVGKSAQFPLHVWLPDAMEGPTPVSALIHAATMVAAGVFLVARFIPVFQGSEAAMSAVALIGAFTALMAATMGLVMNDIKRVMAYSTISQLGYMMAALGVGAYSAAIFHLFNHAFFKALLFLSAGSVNHATGTFDMRFMGGLRRYMPWTYATMMVASLSLAGIFPFSGFWSKDEILLDAWLGGSVVDGAVFWLLLVTVFLTAFYAFRMVFMTFHGEFRGGVEAEARAYGHSPSHSGHEVHLAESPVVMVWPMVLLAAGSLLSGYLANPPAAVLGIPSHWFSEFVVAPGAHPEVLPMNFGLASLSMVVALAGIALAGAIYLVGRPSPIAVGRAFRPAYTLFFRKYFMDDLYEGVIVARGFYRGFAAMLDWFDSAIVDGTVDSIGWFGRNVGRAMAQLQTGQVQGYAIAIFVGIILILVAYLVWG